MVCHSRTSSGATKVTDDEEAMKVTMTREQAKVLLATLSKLVGRSPDLGRMADRIGVREFAASWPCLRFTVYRL